MEKLIKAIKARSIESWEIFLIEKEENTLAIDSGDIKGIEHHIRRNIGLRIFKDSKIGFSSTSGENYDELVENAIQTSKFGREAIFEFPGETDYPKMDIYHPDKWPTAMRVNQTNEIIERLSGLYPGLKIHGKLSCTETNIRLINSSGFDGAYRKSVYYTEILLMGTVETGNLFVFSSKGDSKKPVPPQGILDELLEELKGSEKKAKIQSGRYKVIFSPLTLTETLFNSLITGIYAPYVLTKSTPLHDKLGEQIFSPKLTIRDLVSVPGGERPFDDEGLVTKDRFIVKEGVLSSFLADLYYAKKLGIEPSRSSRRGMGLTPQISVNNIVVDPGEKTLDEIIRKTDEGIIVYMPMGAAMSNLMQGNISFNVALGYHIKNGEITGRILDTVISGNIYDSFKKILAVSLDRQSLFFDSTGYVLPYIMVDGLNVVTK